MSSNQILTILIILGVLMSLASLALSSFAYSSQSDFLFSIGIWLIEIPGMLLLLQNGSFLKTRYSRIAMGLIALVIIGALFKIMHWPYNSVLLWIGCIGIVASYFFHFMKKPIKKRLDYLKLAWVSGMYMGALLRLYHYIPADYRILTVVVMILALLEYMRPKIKNKTLFDEY